MTLLPYAERPYRLGVGIMLLNRNGEVFVAQRADTPGAWQMPQGGIDEGESPAAAAGRELAEETGITEAGAVAETDWLAYDLPPEIADRIWGGRYRGQKQKWFAMRFRGRDQDIRLEDGDHPEFTAWRWLPVDRLVPLIVGFKRPLYEQVVARLGHLAAPE
jgi:putative (di)nucleoside polyphosphate hydrolase